MEDIRAELQNLSLEELEELKQYIDDKLHKEIDKDKIFISPDATSHVWNGISS